MWERRRAFTVPAEGVGTIREPPSTSSPGPFSIAGEGGLFFGDRLYLRIDVYSFRGTDILYLRIDKFRGQKITKRTSFISEYRTRKAEIHASSTYLRHLRHLWKKKFLMFQVTDFQFMRPIEGIRNDSSTKFQRLPSYRKPSRSIHWKTSMINKKIYPK